MSAKHEKLDGSIKAIGDGKTYEVGYGRPPMRGRFKKGQSGNPSGRRRYTETGRAQQLVRQELYRMVSVRENGKIVRMPAIQAIFRKQILLAAQGNMAASKEVLKLLSLDKLDPASIEKQLVLSHEEALRALDPDL
jgi:hypothetical protein